jgi:cytidyltransferase-like protein
MDGKIVYTGGTFDLFHAGHVNFLRQCKNIAGENGEVWVALNSDRFVEEFKGSSPIYDYVDREDILRACKYVDNVIPHEGLDSRPTIKKVEPNFIVIGTDWVAKDYYAQMGFTQSWLDMRGIGLIYVPYTLGVSTTEIKKRLNK